MTLAHKRGRQGASGQRNVSVTYESPLLFRRRAESNDKTIDNRGDNAAYHRPLLRRNRGSLCPPRIVAYCLYTRQPLTVISETV